MQEALKIIKLIGKPIPNTEFYYGEGWAAKEIHEHYMRFMEWFLWQDLIGTEGIAKDNDGNLKVFDFDETERTLEEVYQYYCEKILK
jgi:hypothetical protein